MNPKTSIESDNVTVIELDSDDNNITELKKSSKSARQRNETPADDISVDSSTTSEKSVDGADNINIKTGDRKRTRRNRTTKAREQFDSVSKTPKNDDLTEPTNNQVSAVNDAHVDKEEAPPPIGPDKTVSTSKTRKELADNSLTIDPVLPAVEAAKENVTVMHASKKLPDFSESGLVMIETPPDKVEMVSEEVVIPKRPRKKTKSTVEPTEPLIQIETRE